MSIHPGALRSSAVAEKPGNLNIAGVMIIADLVLLALFWFGIVVYQVTVGLSQPEMRVMLIPTDVNIFVAIFSLALISDVLKRRKEAARILFLYAIAGTVWAVLQIMTGTWIQAFVIPLYIALAVFSQVYKGYFSEV